MLTGLSVTEQNATAQSRWSSATISSAFFVNVVSQQSTNRHRLRRYNQPTAARLCNHVCPNTLHPGFSLYTLRASPMCSFLLSRLTTSLSLLLISAHRDHFTSSYITLRSQSLVTLSIMVCGALPISVSVGLMVVCWGRWGVVGHPPSRVSHTATGKGGARSIIIIREGGLMLWTRYSPSDIRFQKAVKFTVYKLSSSAPSLMNRVQWRAFTNHGLTSDGVKRVAVLGVMIWGWRPRNRSSIPGRGKTYPCLLLSLWSCYMIWYTRILNCN
jgi:hypothetical protein